MLNKTQIKEFAHENQIRLGQDLFQTLEEKLKELIKQGIKRAKENKRKTLLGRDI